MAEVNANCRQEQNNIESLYRQHFRMGLGQWWQVE